MFGPCARYFVRRLYTNEYKHGFSVHLKDPIFDRYYKMLTGWEHQSVNYRRGRGRKRKEEFGFRDYLDRRLSGEHYDRFKLFLIVNGYSSDDILSDISETILGEDSNIFELLIVSKNENLWTQLVDLVTGYKKKSDENCTVDNVLELWDCHFVQEMIQTLSRFQRNNFEIDAGNVCDFDHFAIIRGLRSSQFIRVGKQETNSDLFWKRSPMRSG